MDWDKWDGEYEECGTTAQEKKRKKKNKKKKDADDNFQDPDFIVFLKFFI